MVRSDDCVVCSGVQANIKSLEESNKEIWMAINTLRNRLPTWATIAISLLTFVCGVLMNMAAKR